MQTNNVFLTSAEPCKHKIYIVDDHEQTGQCLGCGAEGRMQFVIGIQADEIEMLREAMREAQPFCMTEVARIRARSTVTQPTKFQLPYELGPLPARVVVDRHTPTGVVTYGYTDAMVTAYAAEQVAKERERCARRG